MIRRAGLGVEHAAAVTLLGLLGRGVWWFDYGSGCSGAKFDRGEHCQEVVPTRVTRSSALMLVKAAGGITGNSAGAVLPNSATRRVRSIHL